VRPKGITCLGNGDIGTCDKRSGASLDVRRGDESGEDMGVSTAPSSERTPDPVRLMNAGKFLGAGFLSRRWPGIGEWIGSIKLPPCVSEVRELADEDSSGMVVSGQRNLCASGESGRPVMI